MCVVQGRLLDEDPLTINLWLKETTMYVLLTSIISMIQKWTGTEMRLGTNTNDLQSRQSQVHLKWRSLAKKKKIYIYIKGSRCFQASQVISDTWIWIRITERRNVRKILPRVCLVKLWCISSLRFGTSDKSWHLKHIYVPALLKDSWWY